MDTIQQRIIEIALQIPEYVGYQAKERRRDADRLVRRQLANSQVWLATFARMAG
jgi:hypothetical protein